MQISQDDAVNIVGGFGLCTMDVRDDPYWRVTLDKEGQGEKKRASGRADNDLNTSKHSSICS